MSRRVNLPGADELFRTAADQPTRAGGSGRVRHDEKITVYISSEELLALETARLALRGTHRIVADRGRIVREAISLALAEFAESGEESPLFRRLNGQ